MKTPWPVVLANAAFALICFSAGNSPAQDIVNQSQVGNRFSPPIQLVVTGDTTNARERTSNGGIFDLLPVGLSEQVSINLVLSPSAANSGVGLAALDGGEIIATPDLRVADNGTLNFAFRAGSPGVYRVVATVGGARYLVQLYVAHVISLTNCGNPP